MESSQFKLSLRIIGAISFLSSLIMVRTNIGGPHEIPLYPLGSDTFYALYRQFDVWNPINFHIFIGDFWNMLQFVFSVMIRSFDKIASQIFSPSLAQLFPSFYDNILILEYYAELFTSRIWFSPTFKYLYIFLDTFQMEYLLWVNLWPMILSDLAFTTLWSFYYFLFPFLFLIAIITGLVFIWKIKMRYLVSSFICMQTMLGLAALTQIINIGLPSNTLFFSSSSFFIELLYGGVAGAAIAFLGSPLFFAALICYLYLEIGFQVIYMDEVTSPALERRKMIEQQLKVVEEIATAPEELATEEEKEASKTKLTISEEAIKFLRNIIEMKIFRKKKVEKEAISDIRRLQAYVDKVYTEIPESRETLTAVAAAPGFGKVTRSAIMGTLLRVGGIIVFSFICFAALIALSQIGVPLSVIESIEVSQPEIVLVLLLPIAFSFPMAAFLIGFIKEYGKKEPEKEKKVKEKEEK